MLHLFVTDLFGFKLSERPDAAALFRKQVHRGLLREPVSDVGAVLHSPQVRGLYFAGPFAAGAFPTGLLEGCAAADRDDVVRIPGKLPVFNNRLDRVVCRGSDAAAHADDFLSEEEPALLYFQRAFLSVSLSQILLGGRTAAAEGRASGYSAGIARFRQIPAVIGILRASRCPLDGGSGKSLHIHSSVVIPAKCVSAAVVEEGLSVREVPEGIALVTEPLVAGDRPAVHRDRKRVILCPVHRFAHRVKSMKDAGLSGFGTCRALFKFAPDLPDNFRQGTVCVIFGVRVLVCQKSGPGIFLYQPRRQHLLAPRLLLRRHDLREICDGAHHNASADPVLKPGSCDFPASGDVHEMTFVNQRLVAAVDRFIQKLQILLRNHQTVLSPEGIQQACQHGEQMLSVAAGIGEHVMLNKGTVLVEAVIRHLAVSRVGNHVRILQYGYQLFVRLANQLILPAQNAGEQKVAAFPDHVGAGFQRPSRRLRVEISADQEGVGDALNVTGNVLQIVINHNQHIEQPQRNAHLVHPPLLSVCLGDARVVQTVFDLAECRSDLLQNLVSMVVCCSRRPPGQCERLQMCGSIKALNEAVFQCRRVGHVLHAARQFPAVYVILRRASAVCSVILLTGHRGCTDQILFPAFPINRIFVFTHSCRLTLLCSMSHGSHGDRSGDSPADDLKLRKGRKFRRSFRTTFVTPFNPMAKCCSSPVFSSRMIFSSWHSGPENSSSACVQ